jgi:exopolysaccharide biosynthesis polyprenyl glycosylphosphotransferase
MSVVERIEGAPLLLDGAGVPDPRTREVLRRRKERAYLRRGWMVRRALAGADVLGLILAHAIAAAIFSDELSSGLGMPWEALAFAASLPIWIVLAKLHGLYDGDEESADNTTVDDAVGVFHVLTVGVWVFYLLAKLTSFADPSVEKVAVFWAVALVLVPVLRSVARARCRRSIAYLQNTVIVGAGDVGQLIARKLLQHPEYGLNIVGFVDTSPKARRRDIGHIAVLGGRDQLPGVIDALDVDRVVIAFSNESHEELLRLIRSIRDHDVQIDVVPRLFEAVGPRVKVHTVEGLPLVGLPPARPTRSSRVLKRCLDVLFASLALLLTAPLFVAFAVWVRLDSPGPVFFRQTRLGEGMREFSMLKFRTMVVGTDDAEHRDYVTRTMTPKAELGTNGLYKLDRAGAVTRSGAWLRRTSLDELPQLLNVLRGDMSLVGPRPCLPYETELFAAHHFERFLVPAGLTGLWQVTARASSTFAEALDMDVLYARGWSLSLDLRLLFRTPVQILRQRRATA